MSQPSFWAPLLAALRQGSKEVGQALPALPTSIKVVEEPGTLGNPTQQMVTEQSRGEDLLDRVRDRYDSRRDDRGDQGSDLDRE